jgi:hypothetical protein
VRTDQRVPLLCTNHLLLQRQCTDARFVILDKSLMRFGYSLISRDAPL